ncbi:MAG: signal recognition particle-docking protein FtsY [Gammaproteobacteria bacterium]|nr:signal recognition particle-docking protein FtsY [Gammaproteobacteria bacterium]
MWSSRKSKTQGKTQGKTQANPQAEPAPDDSTSDTERPGLFGRLSGALARTRGALLGGMARLFDAGTPIDDALVEEIEDALLVGDVGVKATERIVSDVRARIARREVRDPAALLASLHDDMLSVLAPVARPLDVAASESRPFVLLMVGVNGTGKTTTIGKLARRFLGQGYSVMLAAGDTFRAAAIEQLQVWGERNGVPVVAQHTGADSASVIFDALQSASARGVDVLIADTAGRLHTQGGLMEELKKVVRVLKKLDASAPHETMLVVDASMGQNALAQAREFHSAVEVSGITLTKLDGTAKGGIVFAIAEELGIPIRFVGVGEGAEDLRPFVAGEFVDALLER